MIFLVLGTVWGLVVLWSFVAMGRLLARLAGVNGRGDVLWLPAAWGMAGMAALDGWFNLLGIACPHLLLGLVLSAIIIMRTAGEI
jgi:hypothetical protein